MFFEVCFVVVRVAFMGLVHLFAITLLFKLRFKDFGFEKLFVFPNFFSILWLVGFDKRKLVTLFERSS